MTESEQVIRDALDKLGRISGPPTQGLATLDALVARLEEAQRDELQWRRALVDYQKRALGTCLATAARLAEVERERDEWKEAAERFERCDCVPVIISSRSCPKCGRRGVAFESWLEMHKAAEARADKLSDGDAIREALHRWGKVLESDETGVWDAAARELDALVARLAEAERERDRLRETVDATVAQWDEWMAERDAVATELDRYGLPREAKVTGLLRHIYNNRDAAFGGMKLACDGWQERAEAAEARVAALTGALERIVRTHWVVNEPLYDHARCIAREALAAGEPEAATP